MAVDPANSAIDRVRLQVADVGEFPYLSNGTVQWLLDKHEGNELAAAREGAQFILGVLAQNSYYSRIDVLFEDRRSVYKNYRDFLNAFLKDPYTTAFVANAYAGGISISDMEANNADPDNNVRPLSEEQESFLFSNPPDYWWRS